MPSLGQAGHLSSGHFGGGGGLGQGVGGSGLGQGCGSGQVGLGHGFGLGQASSSNPLLRQSSLLGSLHNPAFILILGHIQGGHFCVGGIVVFKT